VVRTSLPDHRGRVDGVVVDEADVDEADVDDPTVTG
jgi:hypothetical protein